MGRAVNSAPRIEPHEIAPHGARGHRLSLVLAPWIALGVMLAAWPRGAVPGGHASPLVQLQPGRGRHARSPTEITAAGWSDVLWRTWREFVDDNILTVAGGVAFFTVLAVFPGIAAFVSFYGMFGDVAGAEEDLNELRGLLPADALRFIGDEMARIAAAHPASLSATFVGGALVSIWSANAGVKALMAGLNVAYEEREKRGLVWLNLISLTFTVGALVALTSALLVLVAMPVLLELARLDPRSSLWGWLRWPILLILAAAALSVFYRFGPSREHARWRWVNLGSLAAAVLWLGMSALFSWYVGHVAHLDLAYGSIGAIIGFMTWIWLSVIVVLAGAELNAELEHQTAVDSTTGPPAPMGMRGASAADSLGAARPGTWRHMLANAAEALARRLRR